jgi:hypothetical protein
MRIVAAMVAPVAAGLLQRLGLLHRLFDAAHPAERLLGQVAGILPNRAIAARAPAAVRDDSRPAGA